MYYGAISTDIKKSSSNWGTFPGWMERAVMLTNNITEYVFHKMEIDGKDASQMILPNSPEGDAYTLFYTHHSKADLSKHLKAIALKIQNLLYMVRDDRPESVPEFNGYGMSVKGIQTKLSEVIKKEKESHDKVHSYIEMYKGLETNFDYIGRIYLRIGIAIADKPPDTASGSAWACSGGV